MNPKSLSDQSFKKLEWGIVLAGVLFVGTLILVRGLHRTTASEPIKLPIQNYERILAGARYVIGSDKTSCCVVEFFDYECTPCRAITPKVYEVIENSNGKASLALQNFPLNMHPRARKLALIASCLDNKDFPEFHAKAFSLNGISLQQLMTTWKSKLDAKEAGWLIRAEHQLEQGKIAAAHVMVDSTPSFFVINRAKKSVYKCASLEAMEAAINKQE